MLSVTDIRNDVKSRFDLDNPPKNNEIKMQINSIIDMINVECPSRRVLLTATGEGGDLIEDLDDVLIEDLDDTLIEDMGSFTNGFSYNATEYKLTIPDSIISVEKIWIDNEEWSNRTYQEVKDTGNSSAEIFYHEGRDIYFTKDIQSSGEAIKFQVTMNYAYINDGEIQVPNNYKQLFVSGSIYLLASFARYENKTLISIHKEIYERNLNELIIQQKMLAVKQDTVRDYDYQGISSGRV